MFEPGKAALGRAFSRPSRSRQRHHGQDRCPPATVVRALARVFARSEVTAPCRRKPSVASLSPGLSGGCVPHDLSWPDLADGRLRLDRLCRNGGRQLSSPAARARHSSRGKKAAFRHLPSVRSETVSPWHQRTLWALRRAYLVGGAVVPKNASRRWVSSPGRSVGIQ